MALIVCGECGKQISDRADVCPGCGCPASAQKKTYDSDNPGLTDETQNVKSDIEEQLETTKNKIEDFKVPHKKLQWRSTYIIGCLILVASVAIYLISFRKIPKPYETIKLPVSSISPDADIKKLIQKDYYDNKKVIVESIDLNNDSLNEVIIRGNDSEMCGATGNCLSTIYKKDSDKYIAIFEGSGDNEFLSNKTNGYYDICTSHGMGAFVSGLTIYKFNGQKYEEYSHLWEVRDENNKIIGYMDESQYLKWEREHRY